MSSQPNNTNKNAPKRNGAARKDKEHVEETKEVVAKPQQQRDSQNKGGRGGQQAQRGGKRQEHKEGDDRKPKQNNRGNFEHQDKNSWIYKFHHYTRPQYDKIDITAETELPALPPKDQILKQPVKEVFEEEMAKLDLKIKELRTTKDDLHSKRREIIDGGKVQGSSMTYREVLSGKINELKTINAKKRACQDNVKGVQEELDVLETEKRTLMKSLSNDCNTEEQVRSAIKQLEYKMNTTSFKSSTEEIKVIKEINNLKNVIPKAQRFSEIKPKITELIQTKNTFYGELKEVKKVVGERDAEIEGLRKEMEVIKEGQNDVKAQGDKVTEQINKVQADISAVFAQKDKVRDDHFHARYDFEVQRDLIHHIHSLQAQQTRIIEREANAEEEIARRAQQIKDLPHPYAKEIETCLHLHGYCQELMRKAGIGGLDSDTVARETQQKMIAELNKEQVQRKLQDGKIEVCDSKEDREKAATIQYGNKKQKGKKQKKQVEYQDIFSLDIMIIQKFGLISISPPITGEDLERKLTEIKEKEQWYKDNGEAAMKEKVEELKKMQKLQEEEAKEQAIKEKLAQQEYEEREAERPRRGRGGNRGRGGYGGHGRDDDDRPRRGGMGRGSRPERENAYRQKSEFEGDDDDIAYAAPARPLQKKGTKQVKQDLERNEDNYPTL